MVVNVSVKADDKVSRLEVIIRIPMFIILGIIMYILMIIVEILWVINIITSLILAKRVAAGFIAKVIEWQVKVLAYLLLTTDERPPWFPAF
jgi:hypothetical protein